MRTIEEYKELIRLATEADTAPEALEAILNDLTEMVESINTMSAQIVENEEAIETYRKEKMRNFLKSNLGEKPEDDVHEETDEEKFDRLFTNAVVETEDGE